MPSTSSSSSRARKTNRGRWTRQEHERFLRGLQSVGENWSRVAEFVPTRTELQVRTHAQKYLAKMQQGLPFPQEPYQSGDGDEDESDTEDADDADADNSNVSGGAYGYGYGGGDGGGAAAPIAGHNLDRRWLPIGGQGAGFAVQQQQHYQQQQEHQEQQHQYQQQLPAAGWGQGVPDGRFSPPLGDAAPFTNWPVAGGDLEEELLQFANMDFSSNDIVINNNGNDGDGGGDAATAYFMGQRNSPNHPFSSVL